MQVYYESDSGDHKKYLFKIPTKTFQDFTKAKMTLRFMEFWAQDNCLDDWKAEITDEYLLFSIATNRDAILFHLSKIYEKLNLTLVKK